MIIDIPGTPLYKAIYETLRSRIQTGFYETGTALPSEPRLREEFNVSTITIRHAIRELSLDGLIEPRQGVGHIVRDSNDSEVVVGLSSFTSDIVSGRLRIIRTLLADDMVPATSDLAQKLDVQTGSMLRHLARMDSKGSAPLSIDEVFMPPSLASKITSKMAASPIFMSLWQKATGIALVRTQYSIWVETATDEDCKWMQINPSVPVLAAGELLFASGDKPVAWIVSRYRSDRGRLSLNATVIENKPNGRIVAE